MKDHRNATRNHLMLQIYKVLQEEGVDVDEVQYSVMAHSLGTVVMHDTLQEMSIDAGSAYQLGNEFHVHRLFMLANTSALLQTNHDPRKTHVRPFIAPFDPGYVRHYYDFAHKFDPVAQFFSYKRYMRKEPDQGFTFVAVDHFQEANIHGYTHYLSDPRVYMRVLQGLYGRRIVPTPYVKKKVEELPADAVAENKKKKLVQALLRGLGDRLEPEPSDPAMERPDAGEVFNLVGKIVALLGELR